MDGDDDGWAMWRNHILAEIKRINDNVEKLADSDVEIRIDVSNLKFMAAIIGGAAGVGGAIVGVAIVSL